MRVPMLRVTRLLCFLLVAPGSAAATSALFQSFDAERFSRSDIATIQLGLAFAGDYRGAADGVWDDRSQLALESFALRRFPSLSNDEERLLNAHVAPLAWLSRETRARLDWRDAAVPEFTVSLEVPWALFDRGVQRHGQGWLLETAGQDLSIVVSRGTASEARYLHQSYQAALSMESPVIDIRREPGRYITGGFTSSGDALHLVSQPAGPLWTSVAIISSTSRASLIPPIAATISFGERIGRQSTGTSPLAEIVNASLAFIESEDDQYQLPELRGSGTAWHVSSDKLVTVAHVVNGCARVTDADGDPLEVLHVDPALDLALIRAPTPSRAWLHVADDADPQLGARIRVLSFPFYALATTSIVMTSGDIASLSGVFDNTNEIVISAPIQPGSSGAPGLDQSGAVVTTVLSRLSDREMRRLTGAGAENFNFGVAPRVLRRWLEAKGVELSDRSPDYDLDAGIPARLRAAVKPILCFRSAPT